ncbi:hypothetical protein TNCV_725881 [Trichonephila clavipes]|nr:hypothetical protein TNCV_725881 [Trichonephila clavipes]
MRLLKNCASCRNCLHWREPYLRGRPFLGDDNASSAGAQKWNRLGRPNRRIKQLLKREPRPIPRRKIKRFHSFSGVRPGVRIKNVRREVGHVVKLTLQESYNHSTLRKLSQGVSFLAAQVSTGQCDDVWSSTNHLQVDHYCGFS